MTYPLGQVFKALRLSTRYTQPEIEAHLEVSGGFCSKFETGLNGITLEKLERLMEFYGLNLSGLIIYATNLTPEYLHRAGKGDVPEPQSSAEEDRYPRQDKEGWLQMTPAVAVKQLAGDSMLVVRSSFEKPSFDLIYREQVQRGYSSDFEAKKQAPAFARRVLESLAQSL